jgi:hypothetical protein
MSSKQTPEGRKKKRIDFLAAIYLLFIQRYSESFAAAFAKSDCYFCSFSGFIWSTS